MQTNSSLLFAQIKLYPTDETLIGAYADALQEEGRDTRAGLVRELLEATVELRHSKSKQSWARDENNRDYALDKKIFQLQRRLVIRPIQVGDFLSVDDEGKYYPVHTREEHTHIVGHVAQQRHDHLWIEVKGTTGGTTLIQVQNE